MNKNNKKLEINKIFEISKKIDVNNLQTYKLDTSLNINIYFIKNDDRYLILNQTEKEQFEILKDFLINKKQDFIKKDIDKHDELENIEQTFLEKIYNLFINDNKNNKIHQFLFRIPLIKGKLLNIFSKLFSFLFIPVLYYPVCFITLLFIIFILMSGESIIKIAISLEGFDFLYLNIAFLLTTIIHEFGHSGALKYLGKEPKVIGFGFYYIMPVFYSDVTQCWEINRWRRLIVDTGGFYAELILAIISFLLYSFYKNYNFFIIYSVSIVYSILFSFNPFIKWDGYWILTDLLGLYNLDIFTNKFGSYLIKDTKNYIKYLIGEIKLNLKNKIKKINKNAASELETDFINDNESLLVIITNKKQENFFTIKTFVSLIKMPERLFFIIYSILIIFYLSYFYFFIFFSIYKIYPKFVEDLYSFIKNFSLKQLSLDYLLSFFYKLISIIGMSLFLFSIVKTIFLKFKKLLIKSFQIKD